ncbi:hypothetical protein D0C36_19105 [Mucilaginibacter conchicola]|uniref:Uncharacterized protein n=1 Tax=Mucilaginibacter conchicola TaxID=2303333 RepID=A0A372NS07_9SPHI|nr:hypothetical protein [Mucilaginibacter conchicola]RFZ91053.1 hypothetical protein D0C36_19105 [Mucilaginibacter conchicola]
MKRNLVLGITLIGAVALSSCSVNKTASNSQNGDDMYYSKAKAVETPEYVAYQQEVANDDQYNDEDDYFYYDDYASRINRFSYFSPFGYYDTGYWGYGSPYYGNGWNIGLNYGWGYGGGYGLGWNAGFGWGSPWGYGWGSPWGYGFGSGWGYGGFYSPYSYWGTGIGYGGGYWGVYSAYNRGVARPYRGNGTAGGGAIFNGRSSRQAYGPNNGIGYIPERGMRGARGNTGFSSSRPGYGNNGQSTRPTRGERPVFQPTERSAPSQSSFGGGGGGGSRGGGGGGGRPARN